MAMAVFGMAVVLGPAFGPTLGGYIVDNYSWPWIFYINVPFALGVGVICHFALRLPFHRREAKLDYVGAALLSLSIAALMIGLEEGRVFPALLEDAVLLDDERQALSSALLSVSGIFGLLMLRRGKSAESRA